ncbi:hypothetical protein PVAND_007894 [Polypedilum vanderplanki]|uniref:Nucleoporin NUP42 n=1 Tax=Polypedilum vanderplanki TaxID=319348 RepID=A0A9J6C806_POLVA|nr:hypothetical protein PVAND_007894 [Polypedilum vanderplanki]
MPVCNFYINGNCRFGSKCNNDHIDLKGLLKSEVDSVINGKQWVLSCFGPFKESCVVPNFITDQSFEEIRMGYIENSKNGNLQQYINLLAAEYNSAIQKLNELKMASPDTIQLIASIYNNSIDQKTPIVSKASISSQPQNPFQSSNIFGGSNHQTNTGMSTSSIFGTSSNISNPFQQQAQGTSIFGSASSNMQTQQQVAQASPFSFVNASSSNITSAVQQPQSSIFTQNIYGQPQQQHNSIFGSMPTPQSQPIANIQPQNSQSIFGQSFNQPLQTPSIFASQTIQTPSNPFQQVQQQSTTNIFGAQNIQPQASQTPLQPSNNIFQIQQTQQQVQTQPFGDNPFQQSNVPTIQINDEKFYSQPGELSAEENEQFQAESFTFGKIPRNPPSKNLCT